MAKRNRHWTPDIVRQRIKVGILTKRLRDHALGTVEMTSTQVKAAEILLRKCVPDMKSVEHSGQISHVTRLSDAELDQRIAALSQQIGIAGAARGAATTH